ncbi:SDR family NAD(P)-dependent oxidoreductase [Pseudooceanicola sediminis]|uniref:SDR family NAD(P)-dependent oxidoreductase n=1 Tax=Pseudooceanicola sediminis TaxID=2211117 RepID=A0A399J3Y4_9RHOB|nr:SDR family NAD(P)-dependent oxidoreductase [Pseudooceanicola sediminis]KAA2311513.1 SDR family NAD(P)-dependent oxidoreductase [Puniceibacterium sp. HSS470]RII40045.1 SDR family NAD(P)-dependent oxidoreductase [Pseudooceanicola sediminis]|tara:strand:- start:117358 stop:118008 length:651 start_codon:yes stop_codon:yes gene_type:complete
MHVVITGASRGIGAALAARYRDRGDRVTGTSTAGDGANLLALDVTQPDSISAFAKAVDAPVDLLICNAGVYLDKGQRLDDGFDAATWADTMAVNVAGPFLTVQALLPQLRASALAGKIAILSSAMGSQSRAPGGSYIYRASKAAVANVGRNLAADLAGEGIAVGIYHPGWVQTDMGGAGADIDTATSTAGLIRRFDALSLSTTGCFEAWDGAPIPF